MERYRINMDKEKVLQFLIQEISDCQMVDFIISALEKLCAAYLEESKKKQVEGIKKARENGVALGRPKLETPENFEQILKEWEKGNMKANVAARACGMGISTFYRRARNYQDDKK